MTFEPINDRTLQVYAPEAAAVTGARPMQGSDPLSEVEIQARREKLWRMRTELAGLEERFFKEYNAINPNDDFDIHCNLSPGKRLKFGGSLRLCRPAFLEDAAWFAGGGGGSGVIGGSADAGLASIHGGPLSGSAVGQGYGGGAPFDQSAKWAAYEKHMLALIDRFPQLRQIVNERSALEERYRAIRRAQLKRNFIVH